MCFGGFFEGEFRVDGASEAVRLIPYVEGEDASLHFGDTTRGDIKVELRYTDLKGKRQQPKVSAVRDGDKLVLRVENQRNRCRMTWFGLSPELDVNCFGFVRLHVSGPLSPSPAPQSSDA